MAPTTSRPKPSTVKRLFALSGNRCAYPSCAAPIVDSEGCVVGEICHIAAQSEDGPRHDPAQSTATRHGFDNLILLCSSHHKRVDRQPRKYTVDVLVAMKQDHHKRFQGRIEAPDHIVQKLLEKLTVSISIVGSSNTVVTGGSVTVGLTYSEVRQTCQDLYEANELRLRGIAAEVARTRAEEFTRSFLDRLFSDASAPQALSDPDMQYAFMTAQRAAARSSSESFGATLVDLLIQRARAQNDDLLRIVLNEAISVAPRLTVDQLDALSLILAVRYVHDPSVAKQSDFGHHFERVVVPFLDGASRTLARYQHLQYAGCATMHTTSNSIIDIYSSKYANVFAWSLGETRVQAILQMTHAQLRELVGILFQEREHGSLEFLPTPLHKVRDSLRQREVDEARINGYLAYMQDCARYVMEVVGPANMHPRLPELIARWTPQGGQHTLTSVGIALGHANMCRRGVTDFHLATWIN